MFNTLRCIKIGRRGIFFKIILLFAIPLSVPACSRMFWLQIFHRIVMGPRWPPVASVVGQREGGVACEERRADKGQKKQGTPRYQLKLEYKEKGFRLLQKDRGYPDPV